MYFVLSISGKLSWIIILEFVESRSYVMKHENTLNFKIDINRVVLTYSN